MPVTHKKSPSRKGSAASKVMPTAAGGSAASSSAAAAEGPTAPHSSSSSSPAHSPARSHSPDRASALRSSPARGGGAGGTGGGGGGKDGGGGSSSSGSKLGVIISALAVLGLITVADLMVLPILTQEAMKASEAAMAPFKSDFHSPDPGSNYGSSSASASSKASGGAAAAGGGGGGGGGGTVIFPYPDYSSGVGGGLGSVAAAAGGSSGRAGALDAGLTPESLDSSPVLRALNADSPWLAPYDNTTCLHGGVLTALGCVCGRRTAGYRCETLTVPEEEVKALKWCGPTCWAGYVWYPTIHFQFQPLPEEQTRWWARAKAFLAWAQGGVLRAVPQQQANKALIAQTDPVLVDWLTSLGPFTTEDKRLVEKWRAFRAEELPAVKARFEARLNVTSELEPKPGGARICFALIVHKDPDQFEALWRVMYRPHHFYVIHVDRGSGPELREAVRRIIDATPFPYPASAKLEGGYEPQAEGGEWMPKESVWEHVDLIPEEDSVMALWGDVTLVFLEALTWLRAFAHADWAWDYYINMSAADIPIVRLEAIEKYLGARIPGSFMSTHTNDLEFRQTHLTPEREVEGEVVVLSPVQAEMPSGRWRARHGQGRIYGCTQWHMWHWTMAYEFATNPEVHGLLLSMKDTGIPDEAFFATAAMWLIKTAEQRKGPTLALVGGDMKYRNEGNQRDLRQPGEFEGLVRMASVQHQLWARKAYTAFVTCDYTNRLLNLTHDCSKYEGAEYVPEVQRRRRRRRRRRR